MILKKFSFDQKQKFLKTFLKISRNFQKFLKILSQVFLENKKMLKVTFFKSQKKP
jgi:hypothetical protein